MHTFRAKALSKLSMAESGSPKFNCALPSVTQACTQNNSCYILLISFLFNLFIDYVIRGGTNTSMVFGMLILGTNH